MKIKTLKLKKLSDVLLLRDDGFIYRFSDTLGGFTLASVDLRLEQGQ